MSEATPAEPRPPNRLRRSLKVVLMALGLLVLVAALAVLLVLRLPAARRAILDRTATAIEEATGVDLVAEDFSLGFFPTLLELRGVELRAAAAKIPFLTVARARAELRPLSLLTRRIEIRSLEVDSPLLDLGASRPAPAGGETAGPGRELVVTDLELKGGAVVVPAATLDPESWLEEWRLEGIEIRGSYHPGETALELVEATLLARRRPARGRAATELVLSGWLRGPAAGPYEVEGLSARGDGLELTASGRFGFGPEAPLEVTYARFAEAARLLPELGSAGRITGSGALDLRRWSGSAQLEASDFPAALVEPWIGRGAMERMGAAGSRLDLAVELDLDPAAAGEAVGRADLSWRRGDERLLDMVADGRGLRLDEGRLDLGAFAGELFVTGVGLRAEMLEPWLGEDVLIDLQAAGTRLDLEAKAVLAAGDPDGARGRAEVVWRRGGATLMRAAAKTTGGGLRADGSFDLESFSGRVELAGADLPAELAAAWIGAAELETLGVAGTAVDLDADLTLDDLRTPALAGRAGVVWKGGDEVLLEATATSRRRTGVPGRPPPASRLRASCCRRAPATGGCGPSSRPATGRGSPRPRSPAEASRSRSPTSPRRLASCGVAGRGCCRRKP